MHADVSVVDVKKLNIELVDELRQGGAIGQRGSRRHRRGLLVGCARS